MKRQGWSAALLLGILLASEAAGQLIVAPGPAVVVPGGGFRYHRRPLSIYGPFAPGFGVYPPFGGGIPVYGIPSTLPLYGVQDNRVSINIILPTVIQPPPAIFPQPDVDLSGVDLDVVGPEALFPDKKPAAKIQVGKDPWPAKKPAEPKKMEPKKDVVAKIQPKPVPPPPPPGPEIPELPEPKKNPVEESQRLTGIGQLAFANQEYGLAAMRFRQAMEVDPEAALPPFLLGQAYFALGKYKDAATALEKGLRLQPDWPLSKFQPREDFYKGLEADWVTHKKQLDDALAQHPNQPAYLFLKAYLLWFDGQRDQALALFAQVQALAPGNEFIPLFQKAALK